MWPIWEWFIDADSYVAWADRSFASSKFSASFVAEQAPMDCNVVGTSQQSERPSLGSEAATRGRSGVASARARHASNDTI